MPSGPGDFEFSIWNNAFCNSTKDKSSSSDDASSEFNDGYSFKKYEGDRINEKENHKIDHDTFVCVHHIHFPGHAGQLSINL